MTLICILFGYGIAVAQNSKMEQVMNSKRKHIAEVAALTGKGDLDKLKPALTNGLNDGMTVGELKEVMVHAYAYCGFPRALRGLQTLVAVLDERKAKGIEDNQGREASPITDTRSKYERGRDILAEISGVPRQMRRKPIMLYWLRKSKYSSKSTSLLTFLSGIS